MGFLSAALERQHQAAPGPKCSIGLILSKLDDSDVRVLREALVSEMRGTQIAAALKEVGHPVSSSTVQRHRRGLCSCQG